MSKNYSIKLKELTNALGDEKKLTNNDRRKLYAKAELLKFSLTTDADHDNIRKEIEAFQSKLKLQGVYGPKGLLPAFDKIIRLLAIWLGLITTTLYIVMPVLIITPFESIIYSIFGFDRKYQIANYGKVFISKLILLVSGVSTRILYETTFEQTFKEASIVCFSHGSTIDAFLVSATVSMKNYALAKDDLFFIPYFNLIMLTFSALPIVRTNLDKAKKMLEYVSQTLNENECISIAPEGTRSKTGQILEFKKGTFHMWEHLQVPIIPMMIFGAFELFPPGANMLTPGRVYVKFLKPILPNEAQNRDDMSLLLRKRMLESTIDLPDDIAGTISFDERLLNLGCVFSLFAVDILTILFIHYKIVLEYGISWNYVFMSIGAFTLLSIPLVYVYAVYIVPFVASIFPIKNARLQKKAAAAVAKKAK